MLRGLIDLFALALCLGSFALIANGKARSGANPPHEAPPAQTRVMLIGDSLSVGAFGEAVQQHLASRFGPQNVMAFASCGSSPENWLADQPSFYTPCGYREVTPDRPPIYRDFNNGHKPRRTLTPKVEGLVRRYRPSVVVVQQGTNWMDRNLTDTEIANFTDRFIRAARAPGVRQIIWIEPPDSSALRKRQDRIHRLIQAAARRDNFEVIDSRELTHYVPGKTGGDGIHYNNDSSRAWAAKLNPLLDIRLRGRLATTR
ncbi:MAG: SGNH/GDSL hydrolase family protein [Chthoniobacterales bacterium]